MSFVEFEAEIQTGRRAHSELENIAYVYRRAVDVMQKMARAIQVDDPAMGMEAFAIAKELFDKENVSPKSNATSLRDKIEKCLLSVRRYSRTAIKF